MQVLIVMPVQEQNSYEKSTKNRQAIRTNTGIHLQADCWTEALEIRSLLHVISQFTDDLKPSKKELRICGVCKTWLNPWQRSGGSRRKFKPKQGSKRRHFIQKWITGCTQALRLSLLNILNMRAACRNSAEQFKAARHTLCSSLGNTLCVFNHHILSPLGGLEG